MLVSLFRNRGSVAGGNDDRIAESIPRRASEATDLILGSMTMADSGSDRRVVREKI